MGCCFSLFDNVVEPNNKETNKYNYIFDSESDPDEYSNPYIIDQKSIFI
jgi:hypothetical protein